MQDRNREVPRMLPTSRLPPPFSLGGNPSWEGVCGVVASSKRTAVLLCTASGWVEVVPQSSQGGTLGGLYSKRAIPFGPGHFGLTSVGCRSSFLRTSVSPGFPPETVIFWRGREVLPLGGRPPEIPDFPLSQSVRGKQPVGSILGTYLFALYLKIPPGYFIVLRLQIIILRVPQYTT